MVELHAEQIGTGDEVTAVAWYDAHHCRGGLVTVTANRVCYRWAYAPQFGLEPQWASAIPKTTPVAVVIDERKEESPNIYVQGIHGARM